MHLGFLTCKDADEKVNHRRCFMKHHCGFAKCHRDLAKPQ